VKKKKTSPAKLKRFNWYPIGDNEHNRRVLQESIVHVGHSEILLQSLPARHTKSHDAQSNTVLKVAKSQFSQILKAIPVSMKKQYLIISMIEEYNDVGTKTEKKGWRQYASFFFFFF
jgi:hypothetical protein